MQTQSKICSLLAWNVSPNRKNYHKNLCETCSKFQRHNTKESLIPHETPNRPWETLGSDHCDVYGQTYLIIVDYYSGFIEIDHVNDSTSITRLKSQFARYGIPDKLITDNGPQFSSQEFRKFALGMSLMGFRSPELKSISTVV